MSKIADFKREIQLVPHTLGVYTCPASKIKFMGDCSCISCPANIIQKARGQGGCYLLVSKDNSLLEAATWLGITTTEAKHRYKLGIKNIENFSKFYQTLQKIRENTAKNPRACPACGVPNETGLNCLNLKRCQRRQRLYAKAGRRYPIRIPELAITNYEFWQIMLIAIDGKVPAVPVSIVERAHKLLSRIT